MNLDSEIRILLLVGVALLSLLAAWRVSQRGRLDPVEQRRIHRVATPRGGGIGILMSVLLLLAVSAPLEQVWGGALALLLVGGAGVVEDRAGLRARWRLLVQLLGATLLVISLLPQAPWWLSLTLIVVIAGWINFVNFMDGANGLIGLQALLAGLAWYWFDPQGPLNLLALGLVAASAGFLPLNFPRARVFLGDAGSYSIGVLTAWLWLAAALSEPQRGSWVGALGGLPLLVDSGMTLARRFFGGRKWYSAHREHLYQWWVRIGASHTRVSLSYAALALLGWGLGLNLAVEWLPWAVLILAGVGGLVWLLAKSGFRQAHRASAKLRTQDRSRAAT